MRMLAIMVVIFDLHQPIGSKMGVTTVNVKRVTNACCEAIWSAFKSNVQVY